MRETKMSPTHRLAMMLVESGYVRMSLSEIDQGDGHTVPEGRYEIQSLDECGDMQIECLETTGQYLVDCEQLMAAHQYTL
jgi:hypothetical protein